MIFTHRFPYIQFPSFDIKNVISSRSQNYVKITAIALAILAGFLAIYYLYKCFTEKQTTDEFLIDLNANSPQQADEVIHPVDTTAPDLLLESSEDVLLVEENPSEASSPPQFYPEKKLDSDPLPNQKNHSNTTKEDEEEWGMVQQVIEESEAFERASEESLKISNQPSDKKIQSSEKSLEECTNELAGYIDEMIKDPTLHPNTLQLFKKLSTWLTSTDHRKDIIVYCQITQSYSNYEVPLIQSTEGNYKTLCELMKDQAFPIEKKREALERLAKEKHLCVPGRAGLLHDICSSIHEPSNMAHKLPWLIVRYKIEILKQVCTEPHNMNGLIVKYGVRLGLTPEDIKAAKVDMHLCNSDTFVRLYQSTATPQGCLAYISDFINSDLSSRDFYRAYILGCLAAKVTDEQIDDKEKFILEKHQGAINFEIKRERIKHEKKTNGIPQEEAVKEWEKILKKIKLKENPFVDGNLYAQYHYRQNLIDPEDNKLTDEAIELFTKDAVNALHVPHTRPPF